MTTHAIYCWMSSLLNSYVLTLPLPTIGLSLVPPFYIATFLPLFSPMSTAARDSSDTLLDQDYGAIKIDRSLAYQLMSYIDPNFTVTSMCAMGNYIFFRGKLFFT